MIDGVVPKSARISRSTDENCDYAPTPSESAQSESSNSMPSESGEGFYKSNWRDVTDIGETKVPNSEESYDPYDPSTALEFSETESSISDKGFYETSDNFKQNISDVLVSKPTEVSQTTGETSGQHASLNSSYLEKEVIESEPRQCRICGQATKKQCTGCLRVFYCSVEHQKKDWKIHRKECKGKAKMT